jgi:hypothetical protein
MRCPVLYLWVVQCRSSHRRVFLSRSFRSAKEEGVNSNATDYGDGGGSFEQGCTDVVEEEGGRRQWYARTK